MNIIVIARRCLALTCISLVSFSGQAAEDNIPDLNGIWTFGRCPDGSFLRCMALQEDDPKLTERARAYRDVIDEIAQPKYDCAPMPIPHMYTDPYNFRLEQLEDRVLVYYGKDDVVRTIWLEGHGHEKPSVNEFLYYGYAEGRYEDGALVVMTDKFTFDPQGLNADFRIPSSTQKQIYERFYRDGDNLGFEVTTIDPFFLKEPWSFKVSSARAEDMGDAWTCELDGARRSLRFETSKYPNDPEIERIEYR